MVEDVSCSEFTGSGWGRKGIVTTRSSQWQLMPPSFSVAFLSFEME
jgi:hypothetical protein